MVQPRSGLYEALVRDAGGTSELGGGGSCCCGDVMAIRAASLFEVRRFRAAAVPERERGSPL